MGTINLPNFRTTADVTMNTKLKDGGVYIDWAGLTDIRAWIYSDAQKALAGRADVTIDQEDSTKAVLVYAGTKAQYPGINRLIIQARYNGSLKTYDRPVFNFVARTAEATGNVTIDEPETDVEIVVQDVSSSILDATILAALSAADRANDAAEAAEHMADIHQGPPGEDGKSPYIGENGHWYEWDETAQEYVDTETEAQGETGTTPDITIGTVTTAEPGTPAAATMTGTPEAPVLNLTIPKGVAGDTPAFTVGEVTTGQPGTPVVVTITGTPEAPVLNVQIPQGLQGNPGSSVDYPFELVNNATTNDATKAATAAVAKGLKDDITQLEAKVTGGTIVTRTGAQGFSDFPALAQATNVVISVEGDTTGLSRIDFLENWSMKARVMGYTDWSNIKTTLPAGCNKMGVYEVSGYTLSLTISVKIDSITERINNVEGRVEDLETGLDKESKGISIQDTLSVDETNFLSAIKKVGYYDPENTGVAYIRLFGFYSDHIQMTLTTDKSTMFDFKADADARPTGEQTYRILNGSKELFLVFDWDKYSANFSNTDYHLAIDNTDFSYIIAPAISELQEQIDELKEGQDGTTEEIGFDGATNEQAVPDTVICPVKRVTKDGKIDSVYLKSQNAGKVTLYVGEVDQLYLFIARESYEINVTAGAQTIDVSDFDIYVFAGEQIAMKCNGNRFLVITDGTPEGEDSFYYGDTLTGLQLQAYTIGTKKIQFAFKATITESDTIALKASVERNTKAINALNAEVGYVKSNLNVVSDLSGNKYRMKVVNGEVKAFALNFSHILAVGNSYTIHPTTTDTAPDLANNLWWGHWAMAASRKETSWPELLQTAIRQKNNSAKVTPVFGRRYETQLRSLSDNDAFLYWEDNQWKNLKPNVSAFSDVDCVLFFLGDNYTNGSGWYEIYKPMVLQFISWFPNATIVCCSCRIREANNGAIAQVASEVSAVFVSMYGLGGASKLGNYVSGDDELLHQIDNSAVAGHFGDYGEWMILDHEVQKIRSFLFKSWIQFLAEYILIYRFEYSFYLPLFLF